MTSILLPQFLPNFWLFHRLQCNTWAKTLPKHSPAYFFDAPYHSIKFRPDWSTLNFFSSKGPPFACFELQRPNFWLFYRLERNNGAKTLQKASPDHFFYNIYQSWKFCPDWTTFHFFDPNGPPFGYFQAQIKMQKKCIFGFLRFSKNFFAQNACLDPRNNPRPVPLVCTCYLGRKSNFDARGFSGSRQAPGVKIWFFQKIFPFKKLHEIFISCTLRPHWYFPLLKDFLWLHV